MFSKKYKKGMADAAKAYQDFGKKQEEALKHILEEVREGKRNLEDALKDLDGNINNLYDYLQSKEKANLYTVYTPYDIKDLDSEEKLFLVGALYTLAKNNEPNEKQQKFFRSVQKYLSIRDIPINVDPLAIENIENITSQKAIYQVVLEYLVLQNGDSYDETELQQEFLESFNLSIKTRSTIANHVELIYSATGADGLAEKYGYIPTAPKAVLLNIAKDKYRNIVAETDDYILTCSRGTFPYEENSLFICYNKKTGESFAPFTNSQLLTNYCFDIFAQAMDDRLWFSFANTVCCKMDSMCLLLEIDSDSVKEICIDGEIVAFAKNHIVYANEFYDQSCANLYDYDIEANSSYVIEQKVLYSRNDSYSRTYYDSSAVYYITQKDNSFFIHRYIFGCDISSVICSFEGKEKILSGFDGAFSANITLVPISLYVDVINNSLYMLFDSKDGNSTYELYTCELNLNSNLQLLNEGIFIYNYPYARQSNDCNYKLLFLTENDIDDVETSPSFILKMFDFKNLKLQMLTRGCGYAKLHKKHQARSEDELSKQIGDIIDELDNCVDSLYKSIGKERPSCSFFSNHSSIIALSDYILCNVGNYDSRRQFNCFVNLLDGSVNNIESSEFDD